VLEPCLNGLTSLKKLIKLWYIPTTTLTFVLLISIPPEELGRVVRLKFSIRISDHSGRAMKPTPGTSMIVLLRVSGEIEWAK
jgi:hypothetical protein